MRMRQQVNAVIWSWGETLRALRRRVGLVPFSLYALVQACVVGAVAAFAYRPFSLFVAPLLRWRYGDTALHYPNNLFVARTALAEADAFLAVIVGAVLAATAVQQFARFFLGRPSSFASAWRAARDRYAAILGASAVAMAATQVVSRVPFWVWGHLAEERPNRFRIVRLVSVVIVVGIQALLVFAVPYVVVGGRRCLPAMRASALLAFRSPVTAYLLVAVPAALELLPFWLSRKSAVLVQKFSPELLLAVACVWIVVIMLTSYATAGGATRFFVHMAQEEAAPPSRMEG